MLESCIGTEIFLSGLPGDSRYCDRIHGSDQNSEGNT